MKRKTAIELNKKAENEATCGYCRWFYSGLPHAQCRYHPPSSSAGRAIWPHVELYHWCKEFIGPKVMGHEVGLGNWTKESLEKHMELSGDPIEDKEINGGEE